RGGSDLDGLRRTAVNAHPPNGAGRRQEADGAPIGGEEWRQRSFGAWDYDGVKLVYPSRVQVIDCVVRLSGDEGDTRPIRRQRERHVGSGGEVELCAARWTDLEAYD